MVGLLDSLLIWGKSGFFFFWRSMEHAYFIITFISCHDMGSWTPWALGSSCLALGEKYSANISPDVLDVNLPYSPQCG